MLEGKRVCLLIALSAACGRAQDDTAPQPLEAVSAPAIAPDANCPQQDCAGRWSHPRMLARWGAQLAYDSAREKVVMFGGVAGYGASANVLDETWEWDGTAWSQLHPAHTPEGGMGGGLVYDAAHGLMLHFGGRGNLTGFNGETWAWDGTDWRQLKPAHAPPPRYVEAIAYDPARQTVVLNGGAIPDASGDGSWTTLFDTWEWTGDDWVERHPAVVPHDWIAGIAFDPQHQNVVMLTQGFDPDADMDLVATWTWDGNDWTRAAATWSWSPIAGYASGLVYDPWIQQVVMWGQRYYSQSYGWDGTQWSPIAAPEVLPFGSGVSFAYDERRQQVVTFGGDGWGLLSNRTELYDGTAWKQLEPEQPEPAGSLVYDPPHQRTLLFQFEYGSQALQTWFWDGEWHRQPARVSMPWRYDQGVAYDLARDEVVLFGGAVDDPLGDTWVFDGQDWSEVPAAHRPRARQHPMMVYDRARERTVMYAGTTADPFYRLGEDTVLTDLWEWDGHDWLEQTPATVPPMRIWASLGYDDARSQTVLFGGIGKEDVLTDTWVWDGNDWTQLNPAHHPEPRSNAGLVYDSERKRLLLVGGDCWADTCRSWSWDGADWSPFSTPALAAGVSFRWVYDEARAQVLGLGAGYFAASEDQWLYTAKGAP